MIFQISGPQLGDYEAAQIAQAWSIRASLILGGLVAFVVAAWYRFRGPALQNYEHDAPTVEEGQAA